MQIDLTDEQQRFVERCVASGQYRSANDVIAAGLLVLAEGERWRAEVRAKIAEGVQQAKAGKLVDGERFMTELMARVVNSDRGGSNPSRKRRSVENWVADLMEWADSHPQNPDVDASRDSTTTSG